MKYQANPVIVDAYKIVSISETDKDGSVFVTVDNGGQFLVDKGMSARYWPKDGDYFVIQSDDYRYINPKDVFERKYSPLPESEAA